MARLHPFELSVNDFLRITKWQLADAKFMDIGASWRLDSLLVRAIPDKDSPSIGSLLFRGKCSRIGFGKLSEKIAIQGIDDAGFELCHFVFDEYDCISESASGSRRGRWTMSANALEFDGFKSVFRPKDFSELPAVQHWRAMPMEDNLATWDGDAP